MKSFVMKRLFIFPFVLVLLMLGRISTVSAVLEPDTASIPIYQTTIAVVGDLMVHIEQIEQAWCPDTRTYDFNQSFTEVSADLKSNGLTLGNLETTFPGEERGYSGYPLFGAPDAFGQALANAGFGLVSTANNHSLDKMEGGLLRTLDVLDDLELVHVGTYASQKERDNVLLINVDGITFAFLSYSYSTNGIPIPYGKGYLINLLDDELITADIARAKYAKPDFIVILAHMGNEYELFTAQRFKDQIRGWFEAGTDIVLTSHPHVLQPMELVEIEAPDGTVRNCFAAYSLGNFISTQRTQPRDAGMILRLHFEKTGEESAVIKGISYIPTWVRFTNAQGHRDIKVIPVFDGLKNYAAGNNLQLRPQDVARMQGVHNETARMLLGQDIPLKDIKREYMYYGERVKAYDKIKPLPLDEPPSGEDALMNIK